MVKEASADVDDRTWGAQIWDRIMSEAYHILALYTPNGQSPPIPQVFALAQEILRFNKELNQAKLTRLYKETIKGE